MILKAEVGDHIERSILVKNPNEIAVDVTVFSTGDLADDIKILDPEFRLKPGQEKKAYFSLDIKDTGTTENNINVQFLGVGEEQGVGLSSTVIIIASEPGTLTEKDKERLTEDNSGFQKISGNFSSIKDMNINPKSILMIITTIVLIVFLFVLLIYSKRRNSKSRSRKADNHENHGGDLTKDKEKSADDNNA